MRGRVPVDKGRMRRLGILVSACLVVAVGCAGHREPAAAPTVVSAKAAVERDARLRYGKELVKDQLVGERPDAYGTRVCSISFAPRPSRPTHELCEIYAVSLDRERRIELAPAVGSCYFAGGATGAIERGTPDAIEMVP
jgi:hypothetical protein